MEFNYGRNDLKNFQRGQENCYLLTNGLGGYSSYTLIGSNARNDHALLMASLEAPNHRYHMLTKLEEKVTLRASEYDLTSQQYVDYTKNQEGFKHLDFFTQAYLPMWTYRVSGIDIKKELVMKQKENTIGILYTIENHTDENAVFSITPWMQFVPKGEKLKENQSFLTTKKTIISNQIKLFFKTNGEVASYETEYIDDLYYEYDAKDGRPSVGCIAKNHDITFEIEPHSSMPGKIVYSMQDTTESVEKMLQEEIERQLELIRISGLRDEVAQVLVRNCNQFISDRESTGGKTILAGYPFFGDWGRDTMIAINGCCIDSGQLEDAKSILRTFIKYIQKGIMPNVFPEGENKPGYNTVDASLLFILATYEYYQASKDIEFIGKEAFPAIREILDWYQKGTDFHIRMDEDGLIMAGSGQEQLTWMDVRIDGFLPTPRHGKPVEINAYWFNGLRIAGYYGKLLEEDTEHYELLAEKVKESFRKQFWMEEKGCLKDVLSDTKADEQIRCNQIWAVSLPFSILNREQERKVVNVVYEHLYTPFGLRSLSVRDEEFVCFYGGSNRKRDLAYHQGTVWAFPLGAYYLSYLKVNDYSGQAIEKVRSQLALVSGLLAEGCVGHIAEIYDGLYPAESKGCFAQAWSISEFLRVYKKLEEIKRN